MRRNAKGVNKIFNNKVIVLNPTCVIMSIQKCQENEFQKILYNWSISECPGSLVGSVIDY